MSTMEQFNTSKEGKLFGELSEKVGELRSVIVSKLEEYDTLVKTLQEEVLKLRDKQSALCEMSDCTHIGETIGEDGKMRCADCHQTYLERLDMLKEWEEVMCPKCKRDGTESAMRLTVVMQVDVQADVDITGFEMQNYVRQEEEELDYSLDITNTEINRRHHDWWLKCECCGHTKERDKVEGHLPEVYEQAISVAENKLRDNVAGACG